MNIYTVSFFGHRQLSEPLAVERRLEKIVRTLLLKKEYVEFLVGRDGEFDLLAASVVRRCKRAVRSDNSALIWVMPYVTAEYRKNEESFLRYYDEIEVCAASAEKHFKAAYQTRNQSMVDRSDFGIFCVERSTGGAYQALQYAQQGKLSVINLSTNGFP